MRILAFSDLHRDLGRAASLVERSADADVVIGAGDFASIHEGLEETIDVLAAIETPTVLVPGNNETADALRDAAAGWDAATVLHGESTEIEGRDVLRPRRRHPGDAVGLELRPLRRRGRRGARSLPRGRGPRAPLAAEGTLRRLGLRREPRLAGARRRDRAPASAARRLRPHPRELGRPSDRADESADGATSRSADILGSGRARPASEPGASAHASGALGVDRTELDLEDRDFFDSRLADRDRAAPAILGGWPSHRARS